MTAPVDATPPVDRARGAARDGLPGAVVAAVERRLAAPVNGAARAAWGTSSTTWQLRVGNGASFALRRCSVVDADAIEAAAAHLNAARVPALEPSGRLHAAGWHWLLSPWIDGEPGPRLLAGRSGWGLAVAAGQLLARLRAHPARGLPVDPVWSSPGAAARILQDVDDAALPEPRHLAPVASRIADLPWRETASHGDFVPANVVRRPGGDLALVDLARLARRHDLVDAAWWALIVRHHHPEAADVQLAGLLASGHPQWTRADLADVAVVRAAQGVLEAEAARRRHHLALLASALTWAADPEGVPRRPPSAHHDEEGAIG